MGMVASYQAAPIVYKYLKENNGIKTMAFLSGNEPLSPQSA